jgi:hypothetical protein
MESSFLGTVQNNFHSHGSYNDLYLFISSIIEFLFVSM